MNTDDSNVVKVNFDANNSLRVSDGLSPQERALSEKKHARFCLWLQSGTVGLVLDARKLSVKVPQQFKKQGDLRLNFCYQFHIPDFGFNQKTVWASLSFSKDGEFFCQVPWTAVYAMYSLPLNQGTVWFDDFPVDLDPMQVLGVNENDCDSVEDPCENIQEAPSSEKCNIISIESARKKNTVSEGC
jgi:hypothetical protein